MLQHWKHWIFRMTFPQSPLMISKITMCWCLIWLQCKTLLKIVTPELVGELLRLELYFTNPLENVTDLIVLGGRILSVAVDKFGLVVKNVQKWIILLCNKISVVSFCSNFGTSVRFPQTMFELLIMTLLLLSTRNPSIFRVNIGSWLPISDKNYILQNLLDVKGTVFSSSFTLQADDARTPTVSAKCMRLLYKIWSFSSLQVSAGRNYRGSRW